MAPRPKESVPIGHYTVALEPTTSSYDSLDMAYTAGPVAILEPRFHMRWRVSLAVLAFDHMGAFKLSF